MKRQIGSRGQIVLPKDIRDHFSIKPGTKVSFEVRRNEIVIKPEKLGEEFVDYFCSTSAKLKKGASVRAIKKLLEEGYDLR
ncbi:MAG: AbrB/MazE/SpoVT family DNA-binding domain-containing protein [Acidobacteria bacterium]|nr:AbrB/MazE/SpoVT family DNA-binding domain-containing protein [Acidobacteriota bacterium]